MAYVAYIAYMGKNKKLQYRQIKDCCKKLLKLLLYSRASQFSCNPFLIVKKFRGPLRLLRLSFKKLPEFNATKTETEADEQHICKNQQNKQFKEICGLEYFCTISQTLAQYLLMLVFHGSFNVFNACAILCFDRCQS